MNNLTTHMSELRRILASIENKTVTEGAAGETGEQFVKRLIGKSGKELVKELGPRVEIATVIKKSKVINGKPTGEVVEREIKEVWEHMPGTELYSIKSVNGIEPKKIITRTADVIKTEVETAAKEGRIVKSANAGKSVAEPTTPGLDPAVEASAKAERLSIPELEKKIVSGEGTAQQQKAYADELAKKKAGAPAAEVPKDRFDSAEVARAKAAKMSREELEIALKNKEIPTVTRKEYEAELARRPKTGEEVFVKKQVEQEKSVVKPALDDGTIKVKEENLLPKKPNETPSEQLERTLKDDPSYKGAWEGLEGTEKEVGFWKWLGRKAKIGGLISIPVALAAGGVYLATRDKPPADPEEEILDDPTPDAEITAAEEAAKKAKEEAEKKTKADAEKESDQDTAAVDDSGQKNQGQKVSDEEGGGKDTAEKTDTTVAKPTAEQSAELAKLKTQIDALVAELAKSKDPAIQKRLAAVRAKLGQTDQAASVTSSETSGWKNIGNNYRKWYGQDGVDEKGEFVKRGTVDNIPYDAGQADEYSKMTNQQLLKRVRQASRTTKP